jgi:hypothetical protein
MLQQLRNPLARETTGFLVFRTDVREPQKIERLRLALASPLSVFGCEAPELNQARFIFATRASPLCGFPFREDFLGFSYGFRPGRSQSRMCTCITLSTLGPNTGESTALRSQDYT